MSNLDLNNVKRFEQFLIHSQIGESGEARLFIGNAPSAPVTNISCHSQFNAKAMTLSQEAPKFVQTLSL